MIPNFTFTAGYLFDSALSLWFPAWRPFTRTLGILSFPFLLTWPLWPKSPRWLWSVKRYKEAEEVIDLFIKKTGTDISTFEKDGVDARTGFYRDLRQQTTPKGTKRLRILTYF